MSLGWGRGGVGWVGVGWGGVRWDWVGWDVIGWDWVGWGGIGWGGVGFSRCSRHACTALAWPVTHGMPRPESATAIGSWRLPLSDAMTLAASLGPTLSSAVQSSCQGRGVVWQGADAGGRFCKGRARARNSIASLPLKPPASAATANAMQPCPPPRCPAAPSPSTEEERGQHPAPTTCAPHPQAPIYDRTGACGGGTRKPTNGKGSTGKCARPPTSLSLYRSAMVRTAPSRNSDATRPLPRPLTHLPRRSPKLGARGSGGGGAGGRRRREGAPASPPCRWVSGCLNSNFEFGIQEARQACPRGSGPSPGSAPPTRPSHLSTQ
jgi:hypothetical protein